MENNNIMTRSSRLFPIPMNYGSMGIIKQRLFLYGRNNELIDSQEEFWQYDIHFKLWSKINKANYMPSYCSFTEVVVEDKWLYLVGSLLNSYESKVNIARFDSENNKWIFLTNLCEIYENPDDRPFYVISMFHYNHELYIFSKGLLNHSSNTIFKYSITNRKWSLIQQTGEIPIFFDNIQGTVFEKKYYIFGKHQGSPINIYHTVFIFDLNTHEWSRKKTFPDFDQYPCDRIHTSLTFSETHGYLSGGQKKSQEQLDDLWSLDLRTLKWHKFEFKFNNRIMMHRTAIYDNLTLFLFGGKIDNVTVNRLQKYIIDVPPLYNLSLNVLMKYKNDEPELKNLPFIIRQDMVLPQDEFCLSIKMNKNM